MTTQIGYDPDRIRALVRLTVESIEGLARIRTADPDAADAVRVARAARRNLEDVWMPLLREIEASAAMISWSNSRLASLRAEWSANSAWLSHHPHRDLGDEAILLELARMDERVPLVHDDPSQADYDAWLARQRGFAHELARRVRANPAFAAELVSASYDSPSIGLLAGLAEFPSSYRADLLAAALDHPWWEDGWEMDKYAAAADTLMESLLDEPDRCLDVLGGGNAARTLAGWYPLDQELVAEFVRTALVVDPDREADLLPAGYDVLRRFAELANGTPFDGDGFQPGAATGLAGSIGRYMPTFVAALENEHATVEVMSHGLGGEYDFTLGTREEVVDLFGALTRVPSAQAELGGTLDLAVRDALGGDAPFDVGDVAEFAELLDLAVTNEDDERGIAAAARRTSLIRLGTGVGLAVAAGTAAAGIGAVQRAVGKDATGALFDEVARTVRADTVGGGSLRAIVYQSIQLEACRRFAPRAAAGPRRSIEARITELESLIADPDAAPADRRRSMLNLVAAVRDAGGGPYLDGILEDNSVDDLNESDHEADL